MTKTVSKVKNPGPDELPLRLDEPLRTAAQAVLDASHAIDGGAADDAGIDKVFLRFPDEGALEKVFEWVHLIASADPRMVNKVASKFESYEKTLFPWLHDYIDWRLRDIGQPPNNRKSGEKLSSPLKEQRVALDKHIKFYQRQLKRLCRSSSEDEIWAIWQALNQELIALEEIRSQLDADYKRVIKKKKQKKSRPPESSQKPPLPAPVKPVEIADRGDHWLSIMRRLACAPGVNALCRRIKHCRPEINEIKVPVPLNRMVQRYRDFLLVGNFTQFEVPGDQDPATAVLLQQGLDRLLPALRGFLQCLPESFLGDESKNIAATQSAGPARTMPKKDLSTPAPEMAVTQKLPSPNEKKVQVSDPDATVDSGSKTVTSETKLTHTVLVDEKSEVFIDGKQVKFGESEWRCLLCLAVLRQNENDAVNKRKFVEAYYGSAGNDAGKRFPNLWVTLKKVLPHMQDNNGRGALVVSGVIINPKINNEQIRTSLKANPAQPRPRMNK